MREFFRDEQMYSRSLSHGGSPRKRYGFFSFALDVIMMVVTSGFWLIWIFVREMRKR